MSAPLAFTPGSTVNIAATTSTGNVTLGIGAVVRVYNAGTVPVFIKFGIAGVTAATTDMPIPPGIVEVFTEPSGATTVAAITASGTATVYFTSGQGI